jgi:hypothetical protein
MGLPTPSSDADARSREEPVLVSATERDGAAEYVWAFPKRHARVRTEDDRVGCFVPVLRPGQDRVTLHDQPVRFLVVKPDAPGRDAHGHGPRRAELPLSLQRGPRPPAGASGRRHAGVPISLSCEQPHPLGDSSNEP